jgi:hypothetical protein
MRMLIMFAVALIILAVGYGIRNNFVQSSAPDSPTSTTASSSTLWPHEIHVSYKNMDELPVHEVKHPF